jgi:hypothetical protein
MKTETIALILFGVAILGFGAWYLTREEPVALTPEQQIAAGIGSLIGGIVGVAT